MTWLIGENHLLNPIPWTNLLLQHCHRSEILKFKSQVTSILKNCVQSLPSISIRLEEIPFSIRDKSYSRVTDKSNSQVTEKSCMKRAVFERVSVGLLCLSRVKSTCRHQLPATYLPPRPTQQSNITSQISTKIGRQILLFIWALQKWKNNDL